MTRPTPANDSPAASASTSTAPRLAFVGGGNMASAVLGGLLQAGHPADRVLVVEPHAPQAEAVREKFRVRVETAGGPALAGADIVVWAVKPQVFAQAPGENLVQSKARVWLASGMRDDSVPVLSTEVAYARLRALGRDVTFRRVPRAGHNLMPEGGTFADVQKEYDAIMAWFERR